MPNICSEFTVTIASAEVSGSNVDWTITENLSWLSLDVSSGSGSKTITATTTENTTGAERTGTISINETVGGNDLSAIVSAVQLNTFLASEISIIGTTSLGTQIKDEIAEENAFNDDNTSYWTGNPDTDPEVSITFDLSCRHELTDIGINFWKADERTTTFSIAVADEESGPFTTIIDTETSADANVTVNSEQIFSMNNTVGRFVKFIGIGNSSSTNWTSVANVNIYGNVACESLTTSIFNNQPIDPNISVFPVPATNGTVTISSTAKAINGIEVFNVAGQQLLRTHGGGTYSTQIDVHSLDAGIYFVKLEDIGFAKFILK